LTSDGTDSDYGRWGDPRYPSPRRLRSVCAFVVDLALTVAAMAGTDYAVLHGLKTPIFPLFVILLVGAAVSFVNRVLIQAAFTTSIGKVLFGLRVVRRSDGGRPKFAELAKAWLTSVLMIIVAFLDEGDPSASYFPAVVRFRDVRALRRARR